MPCCTRSLVSRPRRGCGRPSASATLRRADGSESPRFPSSPRVQSAARRTEDPGLGLRCWDVTTLDEIQPARSKPRVRPAPPTAPSARSRRRTRRVSERAAPRSPSACSRWRALHPTESASSSMRSASITWWSGSPARARLAAAGRPPPCLGKSVEISPHLLAGDRGYFESGVASPPKLEHRVARSQREAPVDSAHQGRGNYQLGSPALQAWRHDLPDLVAIAAVIRELHPGHPRPAGRRWQRFQRLGPAVRSEPAPTSPDMQQLRFAVSSLPRRL